MEKQKIVFVGLSGGVDSSVAALRLKKQGYFVVGVFIKVWHPDFLVCNWEKERLDAMTVAATLDIPFLTCDAVQAYKDDVADYFISEYTKGRTPNPDVMCNKHVKFGAFYTFAREQGADYVATGHYAQVIHGEHGASLMRGVDKGKDQSYFLWAIPKETLAHVLLPIGDTDKATIRKEAAVAGLITADKKDSQGVCFLGHIDIPEFLSHYTELKDGVVEDETGAVIGTHKGALVYTIGQRHGFSIHTHTPHREARYVIGRDLTRNTIIVSTKKPTTAESAVIVLTDTNYQGDAPKVGAAVEVETRYHQTPGSAVVIAVTGSTLTLQLTQAHEQPTIGQSCVLYTGKRCLGGGIIEA